MGFVKPSLAMIAGTTLHLVALVFHIVGLAAPGWFSVELGEKGKTMLGLWEYCYDQPKFTCEDIAEHVPVEAWLGAARAFAILALFVMVFCVTCSILLCFFSQVQVLFSLTHLSALIAALLIFLEFFIFYGGLEKRKNTIGQHFYLQYCFGLTIVALVLTLLSALCFFIGTGRNSKKR